MKSDGEIMEILAAYDLTGSQRTAAELVGCSHHTVAAHVAARNAGRAVGTPARRPRVTDPFLDKIEEWVEASKGRIRADRAHEKLLALGFGGSDRSTRRAAVITAPAVSTAPLASAAGLGWPHPGRRRCGC